MPTRLNLYVSDKALPGLQAFRTLAAERGLSLSEALHQLITHELSRVGRQLGLHADDAARRRDDRS